MRHLSDLTWRTTHTAIMVSLCFAVLWDVASASHIPGPLNGIGTSAAFALLAFIGGSTIYILFSTSPHARSAVLLGLATSSTVIAQRLAYDIQGPGGSLTQAIENSFLIVPAIGAVVLIVTSIIRRSSQPQYKSRIALGLGVVLMFALQVPAHFALARPAAALVYTHTEQLNLSHMTRTELLAHEFLPIALISEDTDVSHPVDAIAAGQRIRADGKFDSFTWAISNPLPNLPRAEITLAFLKQDDGPDLFFLPPSAMAKSALPYLNAHLILTALSGLLLTAPAFISLLTRK